MRQYELNIDPFGTVTPVQVVRSNNDITGIGSYAMRGGKNDVGID
jgi:hypothetical protein